MLEFDIQKYCINLLIKVQNCDHQYTKYYPYQVLTKMGNICQNLSIMLGFDIRKNCIILLIKFQLSIPISWRVISISSFLDQFRPQESPVSSTHGKFSNNFKNWSFYRTYQAKIKLNVKFLFSIPMMNLFMS